MAGSDEGVLLFVWRGSVFRAPDGVQPPKAGSRFFCRHLAVEPGGRVLEIGSGLGLAAVLLAKAGARVTWSGSIREVTSAVVLVTMP